MKLKYFVMYVVATMLLSSCGTSKNSLTYFENLEGTSGTVPMTDYGIKIQPDDELIITVTSDVPDATAVYNLPLNNPAERGNTLITAAPTMQTYLVDETGYIKMPVLGALHVSGMTTSELENALEKKISKDVENPFVRVDLVNFRVNVLGEVLKPGAYDVERERYSVLDALADAGDLTPYGERSNVLIIRENGDVKEFHRINLNSAEALSSPYFYLQQNDVVYVEPNNIRKDNSKYNQNNAYKLSLTSTIVSACSVIASLVIALTVK